MSSILNIAAAKFAWVNNEALLINNNGWEAFNASEWTLDVFEKFEFQLKPASIQIGGQQVEISQPVRSLADLEQDQMVYVPNLTNLDLPMSFQNTKGNKYRLTQYIKQNLLHKIESMAVAHAYALVKLTGGDIQPSLDDQKIDSNPTIGLSQEEVQTPPVVIRAKTTKRTASKKAKELIKIEVTTTETTANKSSMDYQDKLAELIDCVHKAKTEIEAKAIKRYTNGWTAEQIKPLEEEIDKRLEKLQHESTAFVPKQPSMIVRVLNAADLTELDSLEIDVAALDPFIQSEMNKYVEQRRAELTAVEKG